MNGKKMIKLSTQNSKYASGYINMQLEAYLLFHVLSIFVVLAVMVLGLSAITGTCAFGAEVYYVDGSVTQSGDGRAWGTAFKTINEATTNKNAGEYIEVWVKKGTYLLDNTIQFYYLFKEIALYGGFNGAEVEISQRDIQNNITVIDGQNRVGCLETGTQIDTETTPCEFFGGTLVVDGFTFSNGSSDISGGAIWNVSPITLCTPRIVTAIIKNCGSPLYVIVNNNIYFLLPY